MKREKEKVGHRGVAGEERKQEFRILNHLLCGHTLLNDHKAKVSSDQSNLRNNCQVPETAEHFLFHCERFKGPREALKSGVFRIAACENLRCGEMDIKIMSGNSEEISKEGERKWLMLFCNILKTHTDFLVKYR